MLHTTGERTLEKYKIFPYIAWTIFIGFSIFLYSLVLQLQEAAESLTAANTSYEDINSKILSNEERIEALEAAIGQPTE